MLGRNSCINNSSKLNKNTLKGYFFMQFDGWMKQILQIDGFEQDKKVVVIAATNRKEDLDPALIRRASIQITVKHGGIKP